MIEEKNVDIGQKSDYNWHNRG